MAGETSLKMLQGSHIASSANLQARYCADLDESIQFRIHVTLHTGAQTQMSPLV